MTRKKVKLEWIANDNARRLSLKKRRLGLLKKISELSTLCGVNACAIICGLDEIEPTVWPSHDMVQQQLAQFQSLSELERLKKTMNQETYLKEQVKKAREQQMKYEKRNMELEMAQLMYQINQGKGLDELNLSELNGLSLFVDAKIKEISKRIEFFQQAPFAHTSAFPEPHLSLSPQCLILNEMAQTSNGKTINGEDWSTPTEPLLWSQCFINSMNKNEPKLASNRSTKSDMGLPYHLLAGSAIDDLWQPIHSLASNFSIAADMGLPPTNFIPHGASDASLCHGSLVGGSNFGPIRTDIGLGLHPLGGHFRSNTAGSEIGLPHLRHSGGSSSGVGKDIELPFN
ncbi:agamous-like MADS-box protein AGL8 [Herrania umbratica]|uniref:Agamous-like MADS-box protein AGL8 n=1 Tax=Herrania umbratica TaxID=108875 RepID=A0A6J1BET4_9ROSI|nr:agamous-like MADS-box protein AGL8 [Herrania umbratica]